MVSLQARNQAWNTVAKLNRRLSEAVEADWRLWRLTGGCRRLTGGCGGSLEATWRLSKMSSSTAISGWTEDWAVHGASWDPPDSRLVPNIPISNKFFAVQAWKEKFPALKDIGLPSDFLKSDGEPVYLKTCQTPHTPHHGACHDDKYKYIYKLQVQAYIQIQIQSQIQKLAALHQTACHDDDCCFCC